MKHVKSGRAIVFALLAAALYAISTQVSKRLLGDISPEAMAALLYLGAGAGMLLAGLPGRGRRGEKRLERGDGRYVLGMIVLDIAAPILLMSGLRRTAAANVSLLNNFEIVATAVIALALFREKISARLWLAIGLITAASVLLSLEEAGSLAFSPGSALALAACVCWGLENNCTRALSDKDPVQVVVVKGFGSGLGALFIALGTGASFGSWGEAALAMALGFVAYGLSIFFYVRAQRDLGAARTSAYYAASPFIGALLSIVLLGEWPGALFWLALGIMGAGSALAAWE